MESSSDKCGVPELLAPAGEWDALRAAVAGGADAVYFGVQGFNARQRATNFGLEELSEVMEYLHDRNVKGYVALNTLIFSDELTTVAQHAAAIAESGADAVIVQDLGLARVIRRMSPGLPIHASTQMTQTEAGGMELLRSLGIERVIVARELTMAELTRLACDAVLELEVFVHGAMCISFSGQCLASETVLGRSANRGLCAQLCRQTYELEIDGRRVDPDRPYPLSAQDLMGVAHVPELVRLGVAGLKIEGRLKGADYVAAATRLYRLALDAAAAGERFTPPPGLVDDLTMSFSRGQSEGFLGSVDHRRLVHGRFPKKRGLLVGEVVATTPRGVVVKLNPDGEACAGGVNRVKPGDGLLLEGGGVARDEQGGRVYSVASWRPGRPSRQPSGASRSEGPLRGAGYVELTFGRNDIDLAAVQVGCGVWKTDDPQVRRRLESLGGKDIYRRIPLRLQAEGGVGEPLRVVVRQADGLSASVVTAQPLVAAVNRPLTTELLREQFARLGGTPFELAEVELHHGGVRVESLPVMAPKSLLNDLRRRAVERLTALRRASCRHAVQEREAVEWLRREIRGGGVETGTASVETGDEPTIHWAVLVRDLRQLRAVTAWTAADDRVLLPDVYVEPRTLAAAAEAMALVRAASRRAALVGPRVLMPGEEPVLDGLVRLAPDAVIVRNLGSVAHLRRLRPELPLIGDHSLNAANELSGDVLYRLGLLRWTPSVDLTWLQLAALLRRGPPAAVEVVLHQRVPLFHTRHCVVAAASAGAGDGCEGRADRQGGHSVFLRDRQGAAYPVEQDILGRNTIVHSAVQSAAGLAPEMIRTGVRFFRVELLDESADQTRDLLDTYAGLLVGRLEVAEAWSRLRRYAGGEVTEGTWALNEMRRA